MKRRQKYLLLALISCFLIANATGFLYWYSHPPLGKVNNFGLSGAKAMKKYNRLGKEKSPYLLQHKDNPVFWYAWGEEAFQAARAENKPIFLSIGYSTCYWCHMMEKDSFETEEVAKVMNEHFISIKVDREEHPDVDALYMDAVVAQRGQGGWPLSVFLTSDLKPFYGLTFLWKAQLIELLNTLGKMWKENPQQIQDSGQSLFAYLEGKQQVNANAHKIDETPLKDFFVRLSQEFDDTNGGFGPAPKFPMSLRLSVLLRIYRRTGNEQSLKMATKTLTAMASGGMYDHVGGGFHRYSTDERWFAPHFEKMLYDNALLAHSYLEAQELTKDSHYATTARETLDYILRDMTGPHGAFYSAEDAGEVGKEGEFYTWTEAELKKILNETEWAKIREVFGTFVSGNFEHGKNILAVVPGKEALKNDTVIKSALEKLFSARGSRKRPHRDDKVLTSWNGLTIAALAKGHQVLEEEKYLHAAQNAALFIKKTLYDERAQTLKHRYRNGDAAVLGQLDDYAFFIHGLLQLYESDFNTAWLKLVLDLQQTLDRDFWDASQGGYFLSPPQDKHILVRQKEFHDGATPAGNSIALLNLIKLYHHTVDKSYKEKYEILFNILLNQAKQWPQGFPQTMIALDFITDTHKEIVLIEEKPIILSQEFLKHCWQDFLPNKILTVNSPLPFDSDSLPPIARGKTTPQNTVTAYVCEDNLCKKPTSDLTEFIKLTHEMKNYK